MEVSMDFKPSATTIGASSIETQSYSPSMSSPSRKRAFSELDDHNTQKLPTHKHQKRDDDVDDDCNKANDQENQNPLRIEEQQMEIDKPVSAAVLAPAPATHTLPAAEKDALAFTSNTDTSAGTNVPVAPHTPTHQQQQEPAPPAAVGQHENKKQKLSPASKEAKRLEKEKKERLKLEEKARKEAEKRAKDEERKKKEAEREEEKKKKEAEREEERKKREEKKKLKEEERQAKEDEKRKKDEEKEKRERSQMRLNAFFSKPAASSTKPTNSVISSPQKEPAQETTNPASPQKAQDASSSQSDYCKEFPPFFLQSNTQLYPPHQFQRDNDALDHIRQKLDALLKQPTALPAYRGTELFDMIPYQRRNGRKIVSVKTILANSQNAGNNFVDLTASTASLRDQLKKLTMKSLRFGEDVRPPYYGTFTKPISDSRAHKLCRSPYSRIIPDVNYDYDSEAEWEEPEEGEDLDSEGEDEISEDGEDDMDGFLDDEEEQIDGRRRLIVGDQEPVCTGIRWQNDGKIDPDMEVYRIESLSDTIQFPIDPFSMAYWPKPKAAEQALPKASSSLVPPKATLHAYSTNTSSHPQLPLAPPSRPVSSVKGKPFPPEHLAEFKETVEGCDLTKAGLIEVLKKRFPKISKDTLKETVNAFAVRVGQKEAEKRWTCK